MAAVYDLFLVFSVLFLATLLWLPFNGGQAVLPNSVGFSLYLGLVWFVFVAVCWIRGGQTLGMRAWKLRLYSSSNARMTWAQATIRFIVGVVAWLSIIGLLWRMLPSRFESWQDRASSTYVGWA